MDRQEPAEAFGDLKRGVEWLTLLGTVAAFPVVVWTTRFGTWGSRYIGLPEVLGAFWPLLFAAGFGPHPQLGNLVRVWHLTLVLLVVHRVCGVSRRRAGYRCHSRSWGRGWFERGETLAARRAARDGMSAAAFAAGLACHQWLDRPVGALVMVGAAAKWLTEAVAFAAAAARMRRADDARIEGEFYAGPERARYESR